MPILNTRNEYSLFITHKCNWSCPYCAVKNSVDAERNTDREYILKCIDKIPTYSNVTLYGGEPGMVTTDVLNEYFGLLKYKKCDIYVETNGLFIEKNYNLIPLCKEIEYHCSENLNDEKIKKYKYDNVRYMIVVNDNNYGKLKQFINTNDEIKFDIVEATYPYNMKGCCLSSKNKFDIIKNFSNNMTKESLKRLVTPKNFEKIQYL